MYLHTKDSNSPGSSTQLDERSFVNFQPVVLMIAPKGFALYIYLLVKEKQYSFKIFLSNFQSFTSLCQFVNVNPFLTDGKIMFNVANTAAA